jgi:hypothetical protein
VKTAALVVSCLALWACVDRSVSSEDEISEADQQADARPRARNPAPDAAPDAATCSSYGETCEPGVTRYCDGQTYCNWGVATCGPDGKWGRCDETSQAPAGCRGPAYDETCCLQQGYCCESRGGGSEGDCPGVTPQCHVGHH